MHREWAGQALYTLNICYISYIFTIYALHLPYIYYTLTVFTTYLPYVYCIYYRPGPDPGLPRPGPHQAQPYVCRRHSLLSLLLLIFFTFWAFSQRPSLRYGARARIWGQGQAQAYVCRRQFLFFHFCFISFTFGQE